MLQNTLEWFPGQALEGIDIKLTVPHPTKIYWPGSAETVYVHRFLTHT